jgi:hypothetical protein
MSIAFVNPVSGSMVNSFFATVWTAISVLPFGVATMPFRLNCPGTCW